jgi:hypothetical protein
VHPSARRYPPKRLLTLATDVPVGSFHTYEANRVLNALGFAVRPKAGYESVPGGHSGTNRSDEIAATAVRRARPFDPKQKLASYRRAAEATARTSEEAIALREKAVAKHRTILLGLNRVLSATGWTAIEEIPGAIDLLADPPKGKRVLFEAKTVTAANECHQVRAALAQLLEYRSLWGTPTDQLCVVTNNRIKERRVELLRELGIDWLWTDDSRIKTIGKPILSSLRSVIS